MASIEKKGDDLQYLESCRIPVLQESIAKIREAIVEDEKQNWERSLEMYKEGLSTLIDFLKSDVCRQNESLQKVVRQKCKAYLSRAERVKGKVIQLRKLNRSPEVKTTDTKKQQTCTGELYEDLSQVVQNPDEWAVGQDEVVGYTKVKDKLTEWLTLPLKFPHLFFRAMHPSHLLLYGPPGVGKSHLIKTLLREETSVTKFYTHACDLLMRDGPRKVKGLFELARLQQPCLIILDSMDVDLRGPAWRGAVTELLVQLEGLRRTSILVVGISNCPWDVHSSIRRRFCRRFYQGLPSAKTRMSLFERLLGNLNSQAGMPDVDTLSDTDMEELVLRTQGWTGSDLSVVVRDACMEPVRELMSATHFKKVSVSHQQETTSSAQDKYMQCTEDEEGAELKDVLSIPPDQLFVRNVNMQDLRNCLAKTRSCVSQDEISKHEAFTRDYGWEQDEKPADKIEGGKLCAKTLIQLSKDVICRELRGERRVHIDDLPLPRQLKLFLWTDDNIDWNNEGF